MAVFDARQGQVLFKPVTNYYEGKAKRQQLAANELKMKQLEFDVDTQEERFEFEKNRDQRAEEQNERAEKLAERQQKQFEMAVGEHQAKMYAEDLYSRIHAAETVMALEGPEAGMEYAFNTIKEYGDTLPERFQKNMQSIMEDGKITPAELAQAKKHAALYLGIQDANNPLKTHVNYAQVNPDGTVNWRTLRSARPNTALSDRLVDAGFVKVGTPPKGDGSDKDGGSDWKQVTTLMNNEDYRDGVEEIYQDKLEAIGADDSGDPYQEETLAKRDFLKYFALFEVNNPAVPSQVAVDAIFDMMFDVEHLSNGEVKLHKRRVKTMYDNGAVYINMPTASGEYTWYQVNTP